jgi:hypothetical protein
LSRWRRPTAIHNPAKFVCDLAITLALGGDCLADIATLRTEPNLFGLVASDPTVSRLFDTLARDADKVLAAVNTARAQVRATTWALADEHAPDHNINPDSPLTVDLDATLLDAHSEKETPRPPSNVATGSTRCARSSTTVRRAPVNRWRSCCDR